MPKTNVSEKPVCSSPYHIKRGDEGSRFIPIIRSISSPPYGATHRRQVMNTDHSTCVKILIHILKTCVTENVLTVSGCLEVQKIQRKD
jgi:hypothetical protein